MNFITLTGWLTEAKEPRNLGLGRRSGDLYMPLVERQIRRDYIKADVPMRSKNQTLVRIRNSWVARIRRKGLACRFGVILAEKMSVLLGASWLKM